jgi:hypothetical protein
MLHGITTFFTEINISRLFYKITHLKSELITKSNGDELRLSPFHDLPAVNFNICLCRATTYVIIHAVTYVSGQQGHVVYTFSETRVQAVYFQL